MALHVNNLVGFGSASGSSGGNGAILAAIQNRGLTTGLKVLIDAGASGSYSGSGQSWLDLSGNGYDFFLGADGSAAGDDPTFNGSAGGDSVNEYFGYDGGDYFQYDTTVETWMSNMHKDSAIFSYIAGVLLSTATSTIRLFDTANGSSQSGVASVCSTSAGLKHSVLVTDDAAGTEISLVSSVTPNASSWNFLGFSMDEASSTSGVMKTNGTTETGLTVTYPSPGTAAATAMRIGRNNLGTFSTANTRIAFLAIWEGVAIGSTALDNLYADIAAARAYGF